MRGHELTEDLLLQQGFGNPIIIDGKEGLGMTIPPENFSVFDVEGYIGGDHEMDVIDSTRQTDIKMSLKDFVGYFNGFDRSRIFNVISLEFSNTRLAGIAVKISFAKTINFALGVFQLIAPSGGTVDC